jgi:hypothetical protein
MTTEEYDNWIEREYPALPWRKPILVQTPRVSGLACRLCVARLGLRAEEIATSPYVFPTPEEFDAHIRTVHTPSFPTRAKKFFRGLGRWDQA